MYNSFSSSTFAQKYRIASEIATSPIRLAFFSSLIFILCCNTTMHYIANRRPNVIVTKLYWFLLPMDAITEWRIIKYQRKTNFSIKSITFWKKYVANTPASWEVLLSNWIQNASNSSICRFPNSFQHLDFVEFSASILSLTRKICARIIVTMIKSITGLWSNDMESNQTRIWIVVQSKNKWWSNLSLFLTSEDFRCCVYGKGFH